ncbi:MAG: L-rhamnose mutarotase [Firmicutes bacterium]|nr:L-rhamnose mutarotase [Bacillota bacterium]MCM1402159.1 L-rhamnose mutarotase [Bacteroides sp.]MCM1477749.1 L-rhamnose mutarotase [Bacteroides sp.]
MPTTGYNVKKFSGATRRIVQSLSLKDNPELIAEYRRLHSREHIWPEIMEGIRRVGILEMEIYLKGTKLVMILEVGTDFDWNRDMALLATLPRQAEWEDTVSKFQQAVAGQASSDKWQPMERIFHLYD